MLIFNKDKIYSSYLIITNDYNRSLDSILNFAIELGFNKELVLSRNHPDIYILESIDKNIAVDNIRESIVNPANFKPSIADRKFYIIYDACNLNSSSQNTLLKTLEESSSFVSFFLITKNEYSLLDTVKSRCIKLVDLEEETVINDLYQLEYYDKAIDIICNLSYKSISDISNYFNEVSNYPKAIENINHIFLYFLKDVSIYKNTYDEKYLSLKKNFTEVSSAIGYNYKFLGDFIDRLYELIPYLNKNLNNAFYQYNILSEKDKAFMLFNILIDKKKEL